MTSPLTWGAAVLIFALSWVLNSPSPASGFDTLRGIGNDIETTISSPAAQWLKVARNRSLGYPSEPVWLRWSILDSFDLVITDQLMPHGTGLELAQDLLGLRPDLPIIITIGSTDLINVERAKQTGIKAVFNKPIDSELLLSRVHSLIQGTA